jgi:hypothetical protein
LHCNRVRRMHEQRAVFAYLVAVLIVPATSLMAAAQAPPLPGIPPTATASAVPFVGCYEVGLGHWWPWSFGGDTVFVTPPTRIRLLPLRGTEGFEDNGFVIQTFPDTKRAIHGIRTVWSYWTVTAKNHVDLVWTDGLTGVVLSAHKNGDYLLGWAHPHFDFPHFIPRTAHVKARKVSCDQSEKAPTAP